MPKFQWGWEGKEGKYLAYISAVIFYGSMWVRVRMYVKRFSKVQPGASVIIYDLPLQDSETPFIFQKLAHMHGR